jgi:hypothetical protein
MADEYEYSITKIDGGNYNPAITVSSVLFANSVSYETAGLNLQRVGARDYAQDNAENFVRLAENFNSATAPANPLVGQTWYDPNVDRIKFFRASNTWSNVSEDPPAVVITPAGDVTGTYNANTGVLDLHIKTQPGLAAGTYTPGTITVGTDGRITAVTNAVANNTLDPRYAVANNVVTLDNTDQTKIGSLTISGNNKKLNVSGTGAKIQEQGNDLVPRGIVTMWAPSAGSIPAGWVLCDGNNGTPNLVNRFVYGGASSTGATGGSATSSFTTSADGSHAHGFNVPAAAAFPPGGVTGPTTLTTAQIPSHRHATSPDGAGVPWVGSGFGYSGSNGIKATKLYFTENEGGGQPHDHPMPTATHTHSGGATDAAGSHTHTGSVSVLPAHVVLAYIMKT